MQIIVGVLRGGRSTEHEVSLKSGASLLRHLSPERFLTRDIYIDKNGEWFHRGKLVPPEKILRQIDVALLALHAEDGSVQHLLERFGIPYAGSDSFTSSRAMHALFSKKHAQEIGLKTPAFIHIEHPDDVDIAVLDAVRSFQQPVVVKPIVRGSSIGAAMVGGYTAVHEAVHALFDEGAQSVLIEEFIRGKDAAVAVIEGLRGEAFYTPPVMEIMQLDGDNSSYNASRPDRQREVCPGNFSRVTTEELQHLARVIHKELELRHYS